MSRSREEFRDDGLGNPTAEGYRAGQLDEPRDSNPYEAGSDDWSKWDDKWVEGNAMWDGLDTHLTGGGSPATGGKWQYAKSPDPDPLPEGWF